MTKRFFFNRQILNSWYAYLSRCCEPDADGQYTNQVIEVRRPAQPQVCAYVKSQNRSPEVLYLVGSTSRKYVPDVIAQVSLARTSRTRPIPRAI